MGKLVDERGVIVSNTLAGTSLYVMVVKAPVIAAGVLPGQFVHLKVPGIGERILRRPFSVYNADGDGGTIEILYQCVGVGTRQMRELEAGCVVDLIGPVGTGWNPPVGIKSALLVGGGVGSAPLYMLTQQLKAQGVDVKVVLGAQTKDALATHGRYLELLQDCVSVATDDGTFGHAGFCTPLVEQHLDVSQFDYMACCGPEPLMKLVVGMADKHNVPCQVSLERRMACGVGACLSCVVETTEGKKRACVDGPVFDSRQVRW